MQFQLYSQLLRLDFSNDHLLQMYYVLYYDLPREEKEMAENVYNLIVIRERIKLELRGHIYNLKNSIKESRVEGKIVDFLPVFLKVEYLARNTFNTPNWELCYKKERKNLRLYYETLYNQNISSATVDILLKQKNKLEAIPK